MYGLLFFFFPLPRSSPVAFLVDLDEIENRLKPWGRLLKVGGGRPWVGHPSTTGPRFSYILYVAKKIASILFLLLLFFFFLVIIFLPPSTPLPSVRLSWVVCQLGLFVIPHLPRHVLLASSWGLGSRVSFAFLAWDAVTDEKVLEAPLIAPPPAAPWRGRRERGLKNLPERPSVCKSENQGQDARQR